MSDVSAEKLQPEEIAELKSLAARLEANQHECPRLKHLKRCKICDDVTEARRELTETMAYWLPALLADQRRLEWLEQSGLCMFHQWGKWFLDGQQPSEYPTLRAAIDAAMERDAERGRK
jgi:hypothetical protein